jgi:hypothetical protein
MAQLATAGMARWAGLAAASLSGTHGEVLELSEHMLFWN